MIFLFLLKKLILGLVQWQNIVLVSPNIVQRFSFGTICHIVESKLRSSQYEAENLGVRFQQ